MKSRKMTPLFDQQISLMRTVLKVAGAEAPQ